jgi:hypothetical protein
VLGLLWPLIFAAARVTVPMAGAWRIQVFTGLLAALGVLRLRILNTTRVGGTMQASGTAGASSV